MRRTTVRREMNCEEESLNRFTSSVMPKNIASDSISTNGGFVDGMWTMALMS
jgi:hypothetical protein